MRSVLIFLVMMFVYIQSVYGQNSRAGWFVAEDVDTFFNEEDVKNEPKQREEESNNHQEVVLKQDVKEIKDSRQDDEKPIEESVVEKRFTFNNKDLDLAKKMLEYELSIDETKNIVVSPLSFYTVSLLLANGVVDETLYEFSNIFSVLRIKTTNQQLESYLKAETDNLGIYTSIWGNVFSEHYRQLMSEYFKTEVWGLSETTKQINNWAKVRTNQNVGDVVTDEKVEKDDLFLVGVSSFYNMWREPFKTEKTELLAFNDIDGKESMVSMMHANGQFDYYEDEQMQAIRLYYKSGNYMTVFLPVKAMPIKEFVSNLDVKNFKPRFVKRDINLFMPKFMVEYDIQKVQDFYESFGVTKIFEKDNYDFAKMISFDIPSYVKGIYFKTKILVDEGELIEDKTENNASSDIVLDIMNEGKVVNINKPFVFMINNGDFIGTIVRGEDISF